MKEFKKQIAARMEELTREDTVIYLKRVAGEFGIKHIKRGDCIDIMLELKKIKGYTPVQIMTTGNDSLFRSLAIVDNRHLGEEIKKMQTVTMVQGWETGDYNPDTRRKAAEEKYYAPNFVGEEDQNV